MKVLTEVEVKERAVWFWLGLALAELVVGCWAAAVEALTLGLTTVSLMAGTIAMANRALARWEKETKDCRES